jgi:hypothetical protein
MGAAAMIVGLLAVVTAILYKVAEGSWGASRSCEVVPGREDANERRAMAAPDERAVI